MEVMHRRKVSFDLSIETLNNQHVDASYIEMGKGPVILLLHGLLCDADVWCLLVRDLAKNHRCICLDMLGCGNSSKPDIEYLIESQVAFVKKFLDALNIKSCYIIGHSMGSWVAARFELSYSESVLGLVLLAPVGNSEDLDKFQILKLFSSKTSIFDWFLSIFSPIASLLKQEYMWQSFKFMRYSVLNDPILKAWTNRWLQRIQSSELMYDELHSINSDTLIIAAEKDELVPLSECRYFNENIPKSRLEIVNDALHDLPRENSVLVRTMALEFISEIDND